jgi:hypothetical protein
MFTVRLLSFSAVMLTRWHRASSGPRRRVHSLSGPIQMPPVTVTAQKETCRGTETAGQRDHCG